MLISDDSVNISDPSGLYECSGKENCDAAAVAAKELSKALATERIRSGIGSDASQALSAAVNFIGKQNDGNGITIISGNTIKAYRNTNGTTISLNMNLISHSGRTTGGVFLYETGHADSNIIRGMPKNGEEITKTERKSYVLESNYYKMMNISNDLWNNAMGKIDTSNSILYNVK